jgi:hypothetical protein
MSTLAYHWAPCSYTSSTNSLLSLFHSCISSYSSPGFQFSAIGGFKTLVGAVNLNDAMEIQTLKPGKCSLTLDASRII